VTHKINPKIFRIKETKDWYSRGFYGRAKSFSALLAQDFCIREFLKEKLKFAYIDKIEIERFNNDVKIIIYSSKPGLIIGRAGENIEKIKKELGSKIIKTIMLKKNIQKQKNIDNFANSANSVNSASSVNFARNIKIDVIEVKNPWTSAMIAGQLIAEQIEKRMPYRRVLKQAISKISVSKEVQGVKIQVSGRLNGADMARTEWLGKGRMPRQTISANIDYAQYRAYCTYGVIGVKVWIYKN